MVQIYGIDLSMEKFDVSFIDSESKLNHKVVKNDLKGISKFLAQLPKDALLCAEYTGVYGDLLLFLANESDVSISYVSAYAIKHSMGIQRGKSDPVDANRIREYGERFGDKLILSHFVSEKMYELKELYRIRRTFIDSRKRLKTVIEGENRKPFSSLAAHKSIMTEMESLDGQIDLIEQEMSEVINEDEEMCKNHGIVTSVVGVGNVTACELIIKTENFHKINGAKACAEFAGIAPHPYSSGTMDKGSRISHMGDKQLKTLLFLCSRSAVENNKEIRLYFERKYLVEKKPYFLVMNNVANKMIKIIFSLVCKQVNFDRDYIQKDPRMDKDTATSKKQLIN
jgi:transposase